MRKLLISLILLLIGVFTQAQSIRGQIITGFNMSQVDGDEVVGYKKIGANLGVGAMLPMGKHWLISIETLFNQKGAYKKYPVEYDTLPYPYYNLRLNYAEVPIMIHYNDKDVLTFGTGFSYGRLVFMKEIEHGSQIDWPTRTGDYNRGDWNFLFNVRFRMYYGLHFDIRYAYSLVKIRTRTFSNATGMWTRDQFNNTLSFRLVYVFNEKKNE
ncbi:MAG: PorT family protein [Bacteroidales bacterium]|nr:PorT family protein [Bacteroidales bacterium]